MNVSYNWLKSLVEFDLSPEELAQKLTFVGLEVERISPVGDDWCLEFEITTNRPDCLSIVGVAREVAVITGSKLRMPDFSAKATGEETAKFTSVEILDPDLCPRYTAQVIRDVNLAESPDWLKARLEAIGVRPVNNVVDVTNFVTMELGQPLHAFDYDKLTENRIVVRRAKAGESITAINGKKYELTRDTLAICDAREPVAIAGVMGGLFSEVTDRTTSVLLESAYFEPVNTRRTSRALFLESAASYRFERGVDPEMVLPASIRAAQLILELAGGTLAPAPVDVNSQKISYSKVKLRFSRIPRLLGFKVEPGRAVDIFESLGLEPTARNKSSVTVSVPPRRADISREIDLIEEVLRHEGIEKVPLVEIASSDVRREPRQKFLTEVRERMRSFGYTELLTDSFAAEDPFESMSLFQAGEPLRVRNPVAAQTPLMRRSLVPNMLGAYRAGQAAGEGAVRMYEVSLVYLPRSGKLPDEVHVLTFISPEGYLQAKGVLEALFESLRVEGAAFKPHNHPAFAHGRAAAAVLADRKLAFLGEVSREVKEHFGLDESPAVCELDLDYFFSCLIGEASFVPIPRFPKVLRDMALVVPQDVLWQQVREKIEGLGLSLLRRVELFDVYRGTQLEQGTKSLAFSLEFQSPERTLTGGEVDKLISQIASHLAQELGARLRK